AVDVLDLPAEDAAVGIDVPEVRGRRGADGAEGRGLAAERNGAADQDLRRGQAGRAGRGAAAVTVSARAARTTGPSAFIARSACAVPAASAGRGRASPSLSTASAGRGRAGSPGPAR